MLGLQRSRGLAHLTALLPSGKSETLSLGELVSRANESARCVKVQVGFRRKPQFLVPPPVLLVAYRAVRLRAALRSRLAESGLLWLAIIWFPARHSSGINQRAQCSAHLICQPLGFSFTRPSTGRTESGREDEHAEKTAAMVD